MTSDPSTQTGYPQIMGILNCTPDSFSDGGAVSADRGGRCTG